MLRGYILSQGCPGTGLRDEVLQDELNTSDFRPVVMLVRLPAN